MAALHLLKLYKMKKILLLILLFSGIAQAQEPYRQLLITETFNQGAYGYTYYELTNMGDKTINLSEFKLGANYSQSVLQTPEVPWKPNGSAFLMRLPDYILKPGQSFLMTEAYDYGPKTYKQDPYAKGANEQPMNPMWYDLADMLVHMPEEAGDETDSISWGNNIFSLWGSDNFVFLQHNFTEGDSAVIDQFGGVILPGIPDTQGRDVAGVSQATRRGPCMRKFKIKNGNLDFANARGVGYDDSEWIALPYLIKNTWRHPWWTAGNHGNYILDENTLESDVIEVDFAFKKLTVPWGIGRLDDIMNYFKKKPGVAWHYHLNPVREDSLYRSVRAGDKLEIIVCGNEMTTATFEIIVLPPTNADNIVIPLDVPNPVTPGIISPITSRTQAGILAWPRVTRHSNGIDTITAVNQGLSFALRTDSLLKRLEKPENASWSFIWVDGIERPDLKNGDKLKVVAANGNVKEYFIQVQPYRASTNANLASITWPDIPENLKGLYGWIGDTIPDFSTSRTGYVLKIPHDIEIIPHLVAKTANLNANVTVKRAVSLTGSKEDRTISFIVTAEDNLTSGIYTIELVKEKDPEKVQPFFAEPFMSEWIFDWNNRFNFIEIYNPGNQPIDLSHYMFTYTRGNQAEQITRDQDWSVRWQKYVPGYKWQSEQEWQVQPRILVPDLAVNPIVEPGEMFIMANMPQDRNIDESGPWLEAGISWREILPKIVDVQFVQRHDAPLGMNNPWDEFTSARNELVVCRQINRAWYMFKILNDSVRQGTKPVIDPYDFEPIEAFGMADLSNWVIAGKAGMAAWDHIIRKPEVYKPNPVIQDSFGTGPEDSEWLYYGESYYEIHGGPYPGLRARNNSINNIGQHYMIEPTHYKSTISSLVYKTSDGYSMEEEIRGVKTGTTVSTFLNNILKDNENQKLTVKSKTDNSELIDDAVLNNGDLLLVMSADSTNFTQYILEVTPQGLRSDALLSSTIYEIHVGEKSAGTGYRSGTVSGFQYGTRLKTILNNIFVPNGAKMDVINNEGSYVSTKILNFDSIYVDVTVNSDIYFDVVAEDGITRIIYQLIPSSTENDAFILSDIYTVDQDNNLIYSIPRGTNVSVFLSNLVPSTGATMKIVDKMGLQRTVGSLAQDDKVLVTSANGQITRVYHIGFFYSANFLVPHYLAYILSNSYSIDQVAYLIEGLPDNLHVSDFMSNIMPSLGATVKIIDSSGTEKTSGILDEDDYVKVISGDGKMTVTYEIELATTISKPIVSNIQVYPNPTSGEINIHGLEFGSLLQIYSQSGVLVKGIEANSTKEKIFLNHYPSGLYLLVVTKDSRMIGSYKILRK